MIARARPAFAPA